MKIQSIVLVLLLAAASNLPAADNPAAAGSLAPVFKRVSTSVVIVHTSERTVTSQTRGRQVSVGGLGSGVLISADGKVITAAHVVQLADIVGVELEGGFRTRAEILASDPAADVALLQLVELPPQLTPAKLGDSDRVEVGDQILVVGAPLGITHTLTVGHISARRTPSTSSGAMVMAELFQTDAAINHGNSGGPMFNMAGEVVGIVSHIVSSTGGSEGLGFAVTSNMARQLLFEEPSVWSGLEGFLMTGDIARAFNLPPPGAGLLVQRVAIGSPAERLGLKGGNLVTTIGEEELLLGGDIILAVEDIPLGEPGSYEAIRHRLSATRTAGGSVRVRILRAGETLNLTGTVQR